MEQQVAANQAHFADANGCKFVTHEQLVFLGELLEMVGRGRTKGLHFPHSVDARIGQMIKEVHQTLCGPDGTPCASVEFAQDSSDPSSLLSAKKYYQVHPGVAQQVNGGSYYPCRKEVNLAAAPCCSPRYCYEYCWSATMPPQEHPEFLNEEVYESSASTYASYDAFTLSELMQGPQ